MSERLRGLGARLAALQTFVLIALLLTVVAAATSAWGSAELRSVVTLMFVQLVVVVALYTFSGSSGVLSFGHVSFMAVGAYVTALLTIPPALKQTLFASFPSALDPVLHTDWGLIPAVLAGGVAAGLFALVLTPALMRLVGAQAAIATFAVLAITNVVISNADAITRGTSSVIGAPFKTTLPVAAIAVIATVAVADLYRRSRFGLRLRSTRDDVEGARAVGVPVARERSFAWVISACMCGVAGGLYALYLPSFGPDSFYLQTTFSVIVMLVIGGMRSLSGAIVGGLFVTTVTELLNRLETDGLGPIPSGLNAGFTQVLLAALLIVTLLLRPRGLLGEWEFRLPRRRRRSADSIAANQSMNAGTEPEPAVAATSSQGKEVN